MLVQHYATKTLLKVLLINIVICYKPIILFYIFFIEINILFHRKYNYFILYNVNYSPKSGDWFITSVNRSSAKVFDIVL